MHHTASVDGGDDDDDFDMTGELRMASGWYRRSPHGKGCGDVGGGVEVSSSADVDSAW